MNFCPNYAVGLILYKKRWDLSVIIKIVTMLQLLHAFGAQNGLISISQNNKPNFAIVYF
ncbi:hypothetical protein RhiirA4_486284 [Rhizophagus irregularis]|uniref:Uncharacterized protein n=1 Tax=Rhizophagus irregularis TaxID=588596 RepID=A0A2I1HR95_9GLOM|nr:hypothetical protein RhiirA4_486284 [Rhizophagus irregularis]